VIGDTQLFHQGLRHHGFTFVVLVVRGKLQLVDGVTEVMSNTLVLQVWDQLVYVLVVRRLEGATRGEVNIASDLVDTEATRDVATFMRLILQFFRPTFFNTLIYSVKLWRSQGIHAEE
jgi:hypothetical protein